MSVVLAFDTATPATVVGVRSAAAPALTLRDDPAPGARPNHAARLLTLCEAALDAAGAVWADVERIGVGVGPGTFTGLRIGVATARALAQATGAAAVPVSTLAALAAGARAARPGSAVLAVLDARRGEAFAAGWGPSGNAIGEPQALAPEALATRAAALPAGALAVGDGAVRFRDRLRTGGPGGAGRRLTTAPRRRSRPVRAHADGLGGGTRGARPGLRPAPGRRNRAAPPRGRAGMTDTALDIRRLTYADLPQVIAIERRSFPTPWSLAMFVLELSKPAGVCLAARHEGQLAGYVICSRFEDVWHVMNISVDPVRRREGIASSLLAEVIGRVGGDARLTLEVRPSNTGAIALYERFGFLPAGMRRRYYQDNGEDAVIMWRTPATRQGRLDDVPNPGPVPLS